MKLEHRVINYYCTFEYLLSYEGIIFPTHSGKCYCPFHENTDTPAAKLFTDEHNHCLYCFAEAKQYRPHHLLTKGIVNFTVQHVFSAIWSMLSEQEKLQFSEFIPHKEYKNRFAQHYKDYKEGSLSYLDLLQAIASDT